MKVLVTGSNGFLGTWLTGQLVKDGHEVLALVRSKNENNELDGIECEKVIGDITNLASIKKHLVSVDTVFHLAGVIAYKRSERDLMDKVNVGGTKNVAIACTQSNVSRLVHLSSVVAIGAGFNSKQILDENSEYNIGHLNLGYFETKKQAEDIVKNFVSENLIDAVMLNPSTIYGFGDAKKGSRKMQVKVAQGKLPFYPSGGVNVVAVEDAIDGILKAWKLGKKGERYILSAENLLIKELFEIIANAAGVPAPRYKLPSSVLHTAGWLGDQLEPYGLKLGFSQENAYTSTMYHWFKNDKAKKELGFNPRPSKVAIENSVLWMKENGYLK